MKYIVFIDESSITASRFQSLSAFSLPLEYYSSSKKIFTRILQESNVEEFKWEKLRNQKYCNCASNLVKEFFKNIFKYNYRIDVMVWDTHDSRHAISGRDDIANYERMFFHLLNFSMKKRPKGSSWIIRPDERNGIDWKTIQDCLYHVGKKLEYQETLFGNFVSDPFFKIESFEEVDSSLEVLIQIADLFSGLSIFSRVNYNKYRYWKTQNSPNKQIKFNLFEEKEEKLTNSQIFRSQILSNFNQKCKQYTLGVSLDTDKYLKTFNHSSPINFWNYKPQGEYDKAPTRS